MAGANYPTGRVFPEQRGHRGVVETVQEGIRVIRLPFLPSRSPRRHVRLGSLATLSLSALWHGPKILRRFAPQLLLVSQSAASPGNGRVPRWPAGTAFRLC